MDLREHLLGVGAGAITTEDGVKGSLVDDTVEASILILELTNVHLLVHHGGNGLLILLSHLLDNGEGYIDVGDVLEVVLLVHLLGETRVASSDVKDLVGRLDILGKNILDA